MLLAKVHPLWIAMPRHRRQHCRLVRFLSCRDAHHSSRHSKPRHFYSHHYTHYQLTLISYERITMPKFFCDYCDVYLTHDSMSVRKAHNNGRNHLRNVQAYYEQISSDQTQQVINSITDAYNTEGQANPLFQQNLAGGFPGGPMGGMPGMGMPPMGMPPGFPPPGMPPMAGMPPPFMGRGGRKSCCSADA